MEKSNLFQVKIVELFGGNLVLRMQPCLEDGYGRVVVDEKANAIDLPIMDEEGHSLSKQGIPFTTEVI